MIAVKVQGGLGNQMFQYALYYSMKKKGIDAYLDTKTFFFNNTRDFLAYHLDIFDVHFEEMPKGVFPKFIRDENNLIHKVIRRFPYFPAYYGEKETSKFDPKVFSLKGNKYLEGYWQSSKYFEDYLDELRTVFTYKGEFVDSNAKYRNEMINSDSVSIHIRRGDYLKLPQYQNICSEDYYLRAINYIKAKVQSPVFFVFTNDIEWSKQFFSEKIESIKFVTGNDVQHSYMDMILMSYCRHHVIANSSFSWWGSMLSHDNTNGITIAPQKWINNAPTPDIWHSSWKKM